MENMGSHLSKGQQWPQDEPAGLGTTPMKASVGGAASAGGAGGAEGRVWPDAGPPGCVGLAVRTIKAFKHENDTI